MIVLFSGCFSGCFSGSSEKYLDDLKNNNITVRQNAVYNLGKTRASEAVPLLIQLLKDDQFKELNLYIIDALAEINSSTFLGALIDRFNRNDNKVQIVTSVETLIDRLSENDSEIQIAAIDALGKIKAADAVHPLLNMLNTDDLYIKLTAFRALGNIKSGAAVPALTMLLDNHDQYVRYNAAQALKKIGDSE